MARNKALTCAVASLVALSLCPTAFAEDAVPDALDQSLVTMSASDPKPATLSSISVDRAVAGVGDTVTLSFDVDDADGVASASPTFVTGDYDSEGWRPHHWSLSGSGSTASTFQVKVDSRMDEGTWNVAYLTVRDKAGYVTTFYDERYAAATGKGDDGVLADLSAATFEVVQSDDPKPATLSSISVDRAVAGVGDTVTLSYDVDDADGVASASPTFVTGDYDSEGWRPHHWSLSGSGSTASTFQVKVDSRMDEGTWNVAYLTVRDKAGYVTTFYDERYAAATGKGDDGVLADLSAATFEVVQSDDPKPATLSSISVDRAVAGVGDTVTLSYDVDDADGVASASPTFVTGDYDSEGWRPHHWSLSGSGSTASTFQVKVDSRMDEGTWNVAYLTVRDKAGYVTTFYDERYAAATGKGDDGVLADLSAATFEVDFGHTSPRYAVIVGDRTTYTVGSSSALSFTFSGPYELFQSLSLDGRNLASSDYDATSGSTVVTLKPALLATLSAGEHSLVARYSDGGSATATFTIAKPAAVDPGKKESDPATQPSNATTTPTATPWVAPGAVYGVAPYGVPTRRYVQPPATQQTTTRSGEQAPTQPSTTGNQAASGTGTQAPVASPAVPIATTTAPTADMQAPVASAPVATTPVPSTGTQAPTAPTAVAASPAATPATADASPSLVPRALALAGALALGMAAFRRTRTD